MFGGNNSGSGGGFAEMLKKVLGGAKEKEKGGESKFSMDSLKKAFTSMNGGESSEQEKFNKLNTAGKVFSSIATLAGKKPEEKEKDVVGIKLPQALSITPQTQQIFTPPPPILPINIFSESDEEKKKRLFLS